MLDALQSSWLAGVISESPLATASLSSVHLLGFTVVMGSAVLCSLHLLGLLLTEHPTAALVRPATRALIAGLCLSVVTGVLLVLPRASSAAMNPTFRLKMLLLVVGVLLHAVVVSSLAGKPDVGVWTRRLSGLASLVVWAGVAVAGCAFILLE
ncbi:MAG: DUF6644 family protein [Vicinamibacterales bacterium]